MATNFQTSHLKNKQQQHNPVMLLAVRWKLFTKKLALFVQPCEAITNLVNG